MLRVDETPPPPPPPAWMLQVLDGLVLAALVFAPVAIVGCWVAA